MFTRPQRLALLAAFAALCVLRLPRAWAHGRLLDEEGTVFLAYAWHRPAMDALLHPFGGYLNLGANAPALLVAWLVRSGALPLERAPYLTMAAALAVQAIPAALVLCGRGRWLASRAAVIACLLLLATRPATEEVSFNTLHIQFHLALAAAMIGALDVPAGRTGRAAACAVLVLAPLCGPGAIAVLPFLVLRALLAWRRREPARGARAAQTAALAVGTAVQLGLFFTGSPVRGQRIGPATLGAVVLVRLVLLPLSKPEAAGAFGRVLAAAHPAAGLGWGLAVAAGGGSLGLLALAAARARGPAPWLVGPALAVALLSFDGGMIAADEQGLFTPGAGERYNFIPLALLGLGVVALARTGRGRVRRLWWGLAWLSVASGIVSFPRPIPEMATGPAWPAEVAAWRRDHRHRLVTWPASWSVDLSDADLPCPPRDRPDAAAPGYCEAAWMARVEAAPGAGPAARR